MDKSTQTVETADKACQTDEVVTMPTIVLDYEELTPEEEAHAQLCWLEFVHHVLATADRN